MIGGCWEEGGQKVKMFWRESLNPLRLLRDALINRFGNGVSYPSGLARQCSRFC